MDLMGNKGSSVVLLVIGGCAVLFFMVLIVIGGILVWKSKSGRRKISGVPSEVNTFLEKKDIDLLKDHGFPVYTGEDPPDISGKYLMDDLTVVYDPGTWEGAYEIGYKIADYNYEFSAPKPGGLIDVKSYSKQAGDEGEGQGSYIAGKGNCFTIFVNRKGVTYDCRYQSPEVISGCLGNDGLTGFQCSILAKEKTGSGCDYIMPVGYLRLYKEEDGLGQRQD